MSIALTPDCNLDEIRKLSLTNVFISPETNWRSMVETSDAPEPVEAEPIRPAPPTVGQKESEPPAPPTIAAPPASTALQSRAGPMTQGTGERDEVRVDDRLELASQQSTETGSLDGSCRGPLNSSITSTTSTLVPGMLEEAEEEEEEEEDYTPEPISVEVPTLSSRIESWVSKTLENLQLGKSQESTEDEEEEDEEEEEEEEERGQSEDEEDLDSADIPETTSEDQEQVEAKKVTGWYHLSSSSSSSLFSYIQSSALSSGSHSSLFTATSSFSPLSLTPDTRHNLRYPTNWPTPTRSSLPRPGGTDQLTDTQARRPTNSRHIMKDSSDMYSAHNLLHLKSEGSFWFSSSLTELF